MVPCPGTANIEGRVIPNDDSFDLGSVPLHTAFAFSCNTTMGRLAVGLPATALTDAAAQFGLGVDYVTPGLVTVTGNVPEARTPAERVESAIGQGRVTASPFGMALVAASIAHGSTPLPMLVEGRPGGGRSRARRRAGGGHCRVTDDDAGDCHGGEPRVRCGTSPNSSVRRGRQSTVMAPVPTGGSSARRETSHSRFSLRERAVRRRQWTWRDAC